MDLDRLARRATLILALIVLGLTLASAAVQFSHHVLGHDQLLGIARLFDANEELNVPTWYAAVSLMLASAILATISVAKWTQGDRFRRHWVGLAVIFAYLSMDEGSRIHEMLGAPLRGALQTGGIFYYAWVIPAAGLLVLFGAAYLPFLRHLPRRTQFLFVLAGVLLAGGALGGEAAGGWYAERYGELSLGWALIGTVEEFCEMAGVVVFIHGLSAYAARYLRNVAPPLGRVCNV